jgi:rhodanese-related sulfurtransferase
MKLKIALLLSSCFLAQPVLSKDAKKTKSAELHKAAPEIEMAELKSAIDAKKAFVIDVNSDSSYKDAHIPTAIHYKADKDKLASLLPADKNVMIVAYCGGPLCTAWEDAAQDVLARGYKNVKHFKGGIKNWKEAKMPTEKGA